MISRINKPVASTDSNGISLTYNTFDPNTKQFKNDKAMYLKSQGKNSSNMSTPRWKDKKSKFLFGKSYKTEGKNSTQSTERLRSKHQIFKIDENAFVQPNEEVQNIEVNLEEILEEEGIIYMILEQIKQKQQYDKHIKNWWKISTRSCNLQGQVFEGENVRKIVRHNLIIFMLTLGYLEIIEDLKSVNFKTFSSIKSIINNAYNNFIIFLKFLYKHLSEEERLRTKDFWDKILYILNERSQVKQYYKCTQSQVFRNNNDISLTMLKTILRSNPDQNDYVKGWNEIIKNIDNLSVMWVRDQCQNLVKDHIAKNRFALLEQDDLSRKYSNTLYQKPVKKVSGIKNKAKMINPYRSKKSISPEKEIKNKTSKHFSTEEQLLNKYKTTVFNQDVENRRNDVKSLTIDLWKNTVVSEKKNGRDFRSISSKHDGTKSTTPAYQRQTVSSIKRVRGKLSGVELSNRLSKPSLSIQKQNQDFISNSNLRTEIRKKPEQNLSVPYNPVGKRASKKKWISPEKNCKQSELPEASNHEWNRKLSQASLKHDYIITSESRKLNRSIKERFADLKKTNKSVQKSRPQSTFITPTKRPNRNKLLQNSQKNLKSWTYSKPIYNTISK